MILPMVAAQAWEKAQYVSPENEQYGFRKDACGAWIRRDDYGDRDSRWGWEVDHITPRSLGGPDVASNLRPLHWRNNLAKADGHFVCAIASRGTENVISGGY